MLAKLFKRSGNSSSASCQRTPFKKHGIAKSAFSKAAVDCTRVLQQAGYEAYIVGGGVRDLLLGAKPKDFDVATNATPDQVLGLFRKARPIGRRFKIVHVRYGREIIEVTTFRGNHNTQNNRHDAKQADTGVILRDNVYGNIDTDAERRDFTINALYYDPASEDILDFTQGMRDIKSRTLRIIGDPDARYKEDPVRMLRAIRFKVKLGFELEAETEAPIRAHADYLSQIPAARLFEEALKLLMSGYATAIVNDLVDFHLLEYLFPATDQTLRSDDEMAKELIFAATSSTDTRIRKELRVTPAFIYAAFLWPALQAEIQRQKAENNLPTQEAFNLAAQGIISQQLAFTSIPKRFLIPMREIWTLQSRLPNRQGGRANSVMGHPRFRAAYDFMLLREQSGEDLEGLGLWWTQYQSANEAEKEKMVASLGNGKTGKPRRRRRTRKKPPTSND